MSISTINIVFRREQQGISSTLTHDVEIRTEWINETLVCRMAAVIKEFYNLKGWEAVCYYYNAT
tara:strand:+ start:801 stop:992 length:192 start_codon:yes stop_codon:yes gene_type:complete